MTTALQNLEAARETISDPLNWLQGETHGTRTQVAADGTITVHATGCAIGHLHGSPYGASLHDYAVSADALDYLNRAAETMFPDRATPGPHQNQEMYAVACVNDHPDTVHEDIVALFDKTIIELGEQP